MVTSRSL